VRRLRDIVRVRLSISYSLVRGRSMLFVLFFFSSRRRHTRFDCDWSSDVCSSDLSPILDQLPQSQIDYMRSRIPMGRLGHAEESAALVCWLASEECSFSTAATFDISGGRTTY